MPILDAVPSQSSATKVLIVSKISTINSIRPPQILTQHGRFPSVIDTLHEHVDDNYVLADKAYDIDKIRDCIRTDAGIDEISPKSKRASKIEYDKTVGKLRHKVENSFGRLKRFRRLNTRYDKLPQTFFGFVSLAVLTDWINFDFVHVP